VSIIIPVFNGEKYLRECIESAISQHNCEVLVVDDGSTDSTSAICMEYADKIKYYYKENGGTASALNVGIHFANGEYIHWLSADDVLLGNAISLMIGWIGLHDTDPKNCIYYTHYHIIDQYGRFMRDLKEPKRPESDLWKLFYGNGSTSLIHKEIFEKIGNFDARLPHSEDYEFWLRATQLHGIKLQLIPIFTINYRNHPDQLTNKVGGRLDKIIKKAVKERMG
jgi:glycosyltransferase involved in cell wall biosynthesis